MTKPKSQFTENAFSATTEKEQQELRATIRAILDRMIKDAQLPTPTQKSDAVFFALLSLLRITVDSDRETGEYALICVREALAPELAVVQSAINELTWQMLSECKGEGIT